MRKTVLVVAAHPDDEVLSCGGTIARHSDEGDDIFVCFMSNGVNSRTSHQEKERQDRSNNADTASKILGIKKIYSFDFPDNKMDSIALLDIVQSLENVINEVKPSTIYTHHIGDLNIDHQITHKAVMTACRPQPRFCVKEIYAFEVLSSTEWQTPGLMPFIPNVFVDISEYIEIKREVLEIYSEEMREPPHSQIGRAHV